MRLGEALGSEDACEDIKVIHFKNGTVWKCNVRGRRGYSQDDARTVSLERPSLDRAGRGSMPIVYNVSIAGPDVVYNVSMPGRMSQAAGRASHT